MTANAVIGEIKQLPRAEQSRVIPIALALAWERLLSELARQMADGSSPDEVQRLREKIDFGFYGE